MFCAARENFVFGGKIKTAIAHCARTLTALRTHSYRIAHALLTPLP